MQLPRFLRKYMARKVAFSKNFLDALSGFDENHIPVFIISFNNGIYVENMVNQLINYSISPIIIDNNSSDPATKDILVQLKNAKKIKVIHCPINFGHKVLFYDAIYQKLPNRFACTDPDLQLNPELPQNFLEIFSRVSDEFKAFKAGMALSINHSMRSIQIIKKSKYPFKFLKKYQIVDWEKKFWTRKLESSMNLEVYDAAIDTTFFVANKNFFDGNLFDGIRVAGDFSAIHLPWHPDLDISTATSRNIYSKSISNKTSMWMHD